jgi:nucleotide-binding universal stress UspA family protein
MVAWNGSREAARAVADAMPLLKRAASVDVVYANPDDIGDDPGADIGHFLARHGVTVEVSHTLTDGISIGDELLNRTADRNIDMLVMGGIRPFSVQRVGPWWGHPPYPSPHDGPDIAVALIRSHHCGIRA